jgi:hypothetical protein
VTDVPSLSAVFCVFSASRPPHATSSAELTSAANIHLVVMVNTLSTGGSFKD